MWSFIRVVFSLVVLLAFVGCWCWCWFGNVGKEVLWWLLIESRLMPDAMADHLKAVLADEEEWRQ